MNFDIAQYRWKYSAYLTKMKIIAIELNFGTRRIIEVAPCRVGVRWRLVFFSLVSSMLLGACAITDNKVIEGDRLRAVEPNQSVELGTINGEASSLLVAASSPASLHRLPLGLLLRDISNEEHEKLRLDYGVMVVVAVAVSAIAGIREGDIVLSIDKNRVQSVEQFWIWMDMHQWQGTLLIRRGETTTEIEIHEHGITALSARSADEK